LKRVRLMTIGVLIALLVTALGVYLYFKATPYQTEIDHGPTPEAQANPYLAAEYFLRKQGLTVGHANSLDVLPALDPRQHSLLLFGDRYNMTPRPGDELDTGRRSTAVCRSIVMG